MSTFIERFAEIEKLVNCLCQPEVKLEKIQVLVPQVDTKQLNNYLELLPNIRQMIKADKEFLFSMDPSIASLACVDTFTSAFAVALYRLAHFFPNKLLARQIAEYAKSHSGIDIHPEAKIGVPFAIDHGVGTVIGQTCIIGKRCLLYHGVTLGAKHLKDREQFGLDRHPIIEDDVIIYSNTTILGNIVIPADSIVYANQFIKNQREADTLVVSRKDLV